MYITYFCYFCNIVSVSKISYINAREKGAIENGKSIDTCNIGHTRHRTKANKIAQKTKR